MNYKVEDRVIVHPHRHGSCEKNSLGFNANLHRHGKSMADYIGMTAKITKIVDVREGRAYHLDIDNGDWFWADCMLSPAPRWEVDAYVQVNWARTPYIYEGWHYGTVVNRRESGGIWLYTVRADDKNHTRTFREDWLTNVATTTSAEGSTLTLPKLQEMVKKLLDDAPAPRVIARDELDFDKAEMMSKFLDANKKFIYGDWYTHAFASSPITDWMKEVQDTKKERSHMKYKVGDKVEIVDRDDIWYKKEGVIIDIDEDDDDLPYKVIVSKDEDDYDWYGEDNIKIISKKGGLMSRLTILAKKVLDKDLRDLLKAGVLNEDLSINDSRFVLDFVVANFKKELAEAAREKLAEMKEESDEE